MNTEEIFLTQDQINNLKDIQEKKQLILQELGNLSFQKIEIESREKQLKQYTLELLEREKILGEDLQEIYGVGTVDLDTGQFRKYQ